MAVDASRVGVTPALSRGSENIHESANPTPVSPELAFVLEASGRGRERTGGPGPGGSVYLAGNGVVESRGAGMTRSTVSSGESPSGNFAASGVIFDDGSVVDVRGTAPDDVVADVACVPAVAVAVADRDRVCEEACNEVTGDEEYDML